MKGEGMPIKVVAADPNEMTNHLKPLSALEKGKLYIKFDIHFPSNISVESKQKIVGILKKNGDETNS